MSSIVNNYVTGRRIFPTEISMIADDLAGACDTGIEFMDSLGQVTVVVDSDAHKMETESGEGLVVWNTESRDLPANDAYEKVRRASSIAGKGEKRILLKKTDSAFRGNFGHEIAAVMDELNIKICCVAPAIPEFGRVTRNGIQYLDGRPISESFYKKDPRHPVTESDVSKVAAIGNKSQIGVLDMDTIRSKKKDNRFTQLIASGVEVIVTDGEVQGDLNRVVDLFLKFSERIMFVGGQAIGHAVAKHCMAISKKGKWEDIPDGPVIVVCGTLHPKSREQLNVLSKTYDVEPVTIKLDAKTDINKIEPIAEDTTVNLLYQLNNSNLSFLTSPENTTLDPDLVEASIATTIHHICEKTKLSGLILTGGTTAYTVCQRIGVKHIQLRERIASGTILAQVPDFNGMAICNKGGSLGEPDALVRVVDTIKSLAPPPGRRAKKL